MKNMVWWIFLFIILSFWTSTTKATTRIKVLKQQDLKALPHIFPTEHQTLTKRNLHTHKSIVSHEAYKKLDPYLEKESSGYEINHYWTSSPNDLTLRIIPQVDGIPVHGSDRVFSIRSGEWVTGKIHSPTLKKRSNIPLADSSLYTSDSISNILSSETSTSTASKKWKLTKRDALTVSRQYSAHIMSTKHHLQLEDNEQNTQNDHDIDPFFAEKVYFTLENSELAPAWKIVDHSQMIKDRHMKFIDAETGNILASYPLTCYDRAYVFETGKYKVGAKPSIQNLINVVPNNTLNGGKGVVGSVFRGFSSCKYYKCLPSVNGTVVPDGLCDIESVSCVGESDIKDLQEGKDYFSVKHWFATDGRYIDFDRDWEADGYKNGKIFMVWKEAPVFAPRISVPQGNDPIWGLDTDFNTYSDLNTTSSFPEIQAYYALNEHHKFMSQYFNVTTDRGICLIGTGDNCTEIDPKTNISASNFTKPMRFVTNLPDIGPPGPGTGYPSLLEQINQGLGKNASKPVVFPTWKGYPNAFFANGNYQPPSNMSLLPKCTDYKHNNESSPSCISIYDASFTFFGFGIDERGGGNWALNDCIVYHELGHAYVAKIAPTLASYMWDPKNGVSSDPGALNEAWADYFASVHCKAENYMKETYNGKPMRSILNDLTCSDNVGQVHYDGAIFAGGIWKVRKAIPKTVGLNSNNQRDFDLVILQSMSLSVSDESFASQFEHILALLKNHTVLSPIYDYAKKEFEERVLNCTRISPYSEYLDTTFYLPNALTTSKNISLLPNQIQISPRASDWGGTVSWSQFYNSPVLGNVQMGYAKTKLNILFSKKCPIAYKEVSFDSTSSAPKGSILTGTNTYLLGAEDCNNGKDLDKANTIEWQPVEFDNKTFLGKISISLTPGPSQKFYFMPSHQVPTSIVMSKLIIVFHGMHQVWRYTITVLGIVKVLAFLCCLATAFGALLIRTICRLFHARKIQQEETDNGSKNENLGDDRKYQRSRFFWIIFTLTTFLYGGSAGSTIVAIIYGPAADIGLQVGLGAFSLGLLIDLLSLAPWKTLMIASIELSKLQKSLVYSNFSCCVGAMVGFILVFYNESPLAVHVIAYIIFILSFVVKLITFIKCYFV